MKKKLTKSMGVITTVLGLLLLCASSAPAAQPEPGRLGVGLSLGAPTSATAKVYLDENQAVDLHIGGVPFFARGFHGSLFLAGSYLLELFEIAETADFRMSVYGGAGLALLANVGQVRAYDAFYEGSIVFYNYGLGARFPLGVSAGFSDLPLEVYLELSPTAALLVRDRALAGPPVAFHPYLLNAALGARYYFD